MSNESAELEELKKENADLRKALEEAVICAHGLKLRHGFDKYHPTVADLMERVAAIRSKAESLLGVKL